MFETTDATPSFEIPVNIPPGEYWARVRARNEFGLGEPLDEYRLLVTATGFSPPGAPVNLAAVIANNVLTVTWDPGPGGTPATGYILEAGTAPGLSNIAALNLGNTRTFSYTGVPAGVYYLRVRAYNVAGASDPSRELVLNVGNLPTAPGVPLRVVARGEWIDRDAQLAASGGRRRADQLHHRSGHGSRTLEYYGLRHPQLDAVHASQFRAAGCLLGPGSSPQRARHRQRHTGYSTGGALN